MKKRDIKTRLWNFILFTDYHKVIRVKSLRPSWDIHHKALAWPVLLVDEVTRRVTSTPIWTKPRYAFWRRIKP